ncbi:MAG: hypothetical protein OWR62_15470 [Sulfobacillus thermotolerans]|nr:hypothetical protein [Sulfobacillus thermotolerans]
MFDLTTHLGVPLSWTGHQENPVYPLIDGAVDHHVARSLEELRPFLEDPDASGPPYVYHVYEGIHLKSEETRYRAQGISVDLTIIWPGVLRDEWAKTAGHKHSAADNDEWRAEVIEVINGQGLFVLQSGNRDRIDDLVVISAQAGDWVVIPPGFGHVSVNVGEDVLAIVCAHAQDIYLEYEEMARHRGAGVWIGPEGMRENPSYLRIPPVKRLAARDVMARPSQQPLYRMVGMNASQFEFLQDPRRPVPWR